MIEIRRHLEQTVYLPTVPRRPLPPIPLEEEIKMFRKMQGWKRYSVFLFVLLLVLARK